MDEVSALRDRVTGAVFVPSDPGFREELATWVTNVEHNPDVVVGAASESDIVEAIRFARANHLTVDVLSTGHGAEAPSPANLIITTRRLLNIEIDPVSRIASLGAGVRWRDLVPAAAQHGLAGIAGASSSVGVVGYLLGGGLGPLARSHGFSSDYVRGFSVVTGDGELVTADESHHPELFWALRGGKRQLGVVTEMRLALVEMSTLYAGSLLFEAESIERVLRVWVDYTASAPDEVTTSVAVMRLPDFPQVPKPMRGKTFLALRFAYAGDAADGEKFASPLRGAAPVFLDSVGRIAVTAMDTIHNDPPDPGPGWVHGRMLSAIDHNFADVLLDLVGPQARVPFVVVELRHLGGATRRDVVGGSAVGGRNADFALALVGVPNPELFTEVLPLAAREIVSALAPWILPITNVNFLSHGGVDVTESSPWPADIANRLDVVRRQYDHDGVFTLGSRAR
jgi:FAD/FMN-containing dehydrogenase